MEFYSHVEKDERQKIVKKKLLSLHLSEVATQMKINIEALPIDDKEKLSEAAFLMGICHDFGKYTPYFQNYLLKGRKEGELHFHGFISAVFCAYMMGMYFKSQQHYHIYMPLLSYFFVLHHHGNLGDISEDIITKRMLREPEALEERTDLMDRLNIFNKQIEALRDLKDEIEAQYRQIGLNLSLDHFFSHWQDTLRQLDLLHHKLFENEQEEVRLYLLILGMTLYSTLIDNDKMDAAGVTKSSRKILQEDLVDRYKTVNFADTQHRPLDDMRNEIYSAVMDSISQVSLDQHFLTLTAPTGTGKTLTGFSAALKLRKRIEVEKEYCPRIIYSLPFTSIIDQNYDVIQEILTQIQDFEQNKNLYLVKHHHLSELKYIKEGDEQPLEKALMLIESWEAEIIVTTFMQLFYTLIGYKNRFLKKYHNIAGSIIILDEIQNIDVKYWPLVNSIVKLISRYLGCYIILMTATKPLIFAENETVELVPNASKYFHSLNRVSIIPETQPMTVEELSQDFLERYDKDRSYLIIMNTIGSSIQLYERIRNQLKDQYNTKCIYLSTNIVPYHRSRRVEYIKKCIKRGLKVVVVATQVVEAGVDIDMDVVLRDIGPIDSIIQAAGRCKRNSIDDHGKVHIYKIVEKKDEREEGYLLAKRIYGPIHCSVASKALEQGIIEEKSFYELINRYFTEIEQSKSHQESEEILKALDSFSFSRKSSDAIAVSNFSLINDRPFYVDVFVEINKKAQVIWNEYSNTVLNEEDENKKRQSRLKLKNKLNLYTISIPDKLAAGLEPYMAVSKDGGFFKLPLEKLDQYYDIRTGFKRSLEMETWIF